MLSGAACGSKLRLITILLSAHRFRLNSSLSPHSSLSPQIQALERSQAHGLSQPTDTGSISLSPQIQAHERSQPAPTDSGFRALSAYGCRLSSALRLTSALSPQIQARDSATALQAAVVQPHRALDRLRIYSTLAAGLEPAAPSTTGDYPLSQHQYYEAITTTDSERQADRARRQTARLADYPV